MSNGIYAVVSTTEELPAGYIRLPISRTDGKKGKSGTCIHVPAISDAVRSVIYNSPIGELWFSAQVASHLSEMASSLNKAGNSITSEKLGVTAVLVSMAASLEAQRMTKETIGKWFDADLAPLVSARIQELLAGISNDKLEKLVSGYREQFQTLAGRDVSMTKEMKAQLIKAVELLPGDYEPSVIGEKVLTALATVQEASALLNVL